MLSLSRHFIIRVVSMNWRFPEQLWRGAALAGFTARVTMLPIPSDVPGVVDFALQSYSLACIQHRTELLKFASLVNDLKPRSVLEIGTFRGGTLFVFCRLAAPDATIISLDLWRYTPLYAPVFHSFCRRSQKLHVLKGDSSKPEQLSRVKDHLPAGSLDLLFIDGNHTYPAVKSDFELYSPLVRPGGMIAFHDITAHMDDCKVPQLWAEVKDRYRHAEIVEDANNRWGGIGVLYV